MSQKKRELILQSAKEAFAKYGYKKTTLDDIGGKIGLNKTSLYHYFKNGKEEIFVSVILQEFQQFMDNLHSEITTEMNCENKILTYFEQYLRFWTQQSMVLPQLSQIDQSDMQNFMVSGVEIYSNIEKDEKSFFKDILVGCISDGHIQECDVEKTTEFIFALVDGIKDRYIGFSRKQSGGENQQEVMIGDVKSALKIFLGGLK